MGPTQCKSGSHNRIVSNRNHLICTIFNTNLSPLASFYATIDYTFEKKKIATGKMLVKQIMKFELRGPELHGCICTPTAGYFHDKTKTSQEDLLVDYFIIYC